MTAGNIATPLRRIHAALLVTALALTFGIGLLAGLAAPRTVGQVVEAASNVGVVAASSGSGTSATVATNPLRLTELQAAEIGGGGLTIDNAAPNAGVGAAPSGSGTSATVATNPLRLTELHAAEIGGGGLTIDANSPSGR